MTLVKAEVRTEIGLSMKVKIAIRTKTTDAKAAVCSAKSLRKLFKKH